MIFNEDFKKKKLKNLLDNDDSIVVVGAVFVVASRPGSFGLRYWIKAKTKRMMMMKRRNILWKILRIKSKIPIRLMILTILAVGWWRSGGTCCPAEVVRSEESSQTDPESVDR